MFGFAGALSEIGLPQLDIPLALFSFNVGVEIGQLLFIAAVFAVIAAHGKSCAASCSHGLCGRGAWRRTPSAACRRSGSSNESRLFENGTVLGRPASLDHPFDLGKLRQLLDHSEQAEHPGAVDRVPATARIELRKDALQVPFDGLGAEVESARDFLVAHPLRQVREH